MTPVLRTVSCGGQGGEGVVVVSQKSKKGGNTPTEIFGLCVAILKVPDENLQKLLTAITPWDWLQSRHYLNQQRATGGEN